MRSLVQKKSSYMPKPVWHAPWKLMRVISGHLGWVRSVTVEPGNEWFATGECWSAVVDGAAAGVVVIVFFIAARIDLADW